MMTLPQGLLTASVIALSATLGGGIYEHLVLDPVWPSQPRLIQSAHGGVKRGRFWLPAHVLFEVLLLCSLALCWKLASICRFAEPRDPFVTSFAEPFPPLN